MVRVASPAPAAAVPGASKVAATVCAVAAVTVRTSGTAGSTLFFRRPAPSMPAVAVRVGEGHRRYSKELDAGTGRPVRDERPCGARLEAVRLGSGKRDG